MKFNLFMYAWLWFNIKNILFIWFKNEDQKGIWKSKKQTQHIF